MDLKHLQVFEQFINNVDIVFWVCNINITEFIYVSPTYEKIWGRSCDSLYKKPTSFLDPVHPEDLPNRITAIKNNPTSMNEEYRILDANGATRWICDRTFPLKLENEDAYWLIGISEDITYRKQAEKETYKALQRETELSNAKSELIATISHEISTPLSVIQSSIDMLQHNIHRLNDEKKQKHFHKVESAIQHITSVVQDVLIIAENEAGSLQFQLTEFDIVQLCEEIISTVVNYNSNRIELKVYKNATTTVMLDIKLITHILKNLLENALKYSPPNKQVQFDLSVSPTQIVFRVQDRGIGIPTESIGQIFNSFYRANNVNTTPGTGLGLSVVKRCIDLHNGGIAVNSTVGEGSIFTVTLPR